MVDEGSWRAELDRWLEPFLTELNHAARRSMCPHYIAGLIGLGKRKSMQPMAARQDGLSYDRLQHFISVGRWDEAPLARTLLAEADRMVGGRDAVLVIDDTSLPKKGRHSVGVAPQYLSTQGKTGNCQALVSLTLARREVPVLVGLRLFLPTSWIRGDGHYAKPEAMAWCETNGLQYVFGLPGSKPLSRKMEDIADAVRTEPAIGDKPVVRNYAETRHRAGSWNRERRAVARIEATRLGLDIRFVVTNVERGSPEWVYDSLYCARGQAENLIKLHKSQLRSDRTSCRSALANQVRLVLHTAAYWLMLGVRDAIPKVRDLAKAEFTTLRLRLLKVAARIVETRHRVRIAFATACPEADVIAGLSAALLRRRI